MTIAASRRSAALAVLYTVLCIGYVHGQSVDLKFDAIPTTSELHSGEPLVVRFALTNVSNTNIFVARTFQLGQHVTLEIKDPSGKVAPWCGRITEQTIPTSSFLILKPGHRIERTMKITCTGHCSRDYLEQGAGCYELREVGRFSAIAKYHMDIPASALRKFAKGAKIVTGRIESKPFEFAVSSGGRVL